MTIHDRRRTDPVATHAYTVPVVREVPIRPGSGPTASGPHELEQPLAYAADSHAW
jgi:hypothetical protein